MSTNDGKAIDSPIARGSLEERIAILEERTTPKPKSLFEHLRDWGGVVSLAIALAYSFPLGLWDRFILPERERTAKELADLRRIIEQSTVLAGETGKALAGVSEPQLRDLVSRAATSRLYILMAQNKAAFERHLNEFSAPESLIIGWNFVATNQFDTGIKFYRRAHDDASEDNVTAVEALRLHAKALLSPGPVQNKEAARKLFMAALRRVQSARSYREMWSYVTLTAEWGISEMLDGDWACGEQMLAQFRETYSQFGPFLNDQSNFGQIVESQTSALKKRPNQPMNGC